MPDASTPTAIQLDGLSKRFGSRTAVDGVSLTVRTGSVYGLVGPNGAGKTTLMRTMLGFTRASGGSATVLGQRMPGARAGVYPRIGVIIEEPRFYPFMSGRDNLRQIAAARPEAISDARIEQVLGTVDLAGRAGDRVKTYSLGMRQRLGIARALLHDPELLILDEPSNGLDPPGIRDMRVLLRAIADEGRTVFVSSHLLAEMELLCDDIAVLKDGKVIADGPVASLTSASDTGATDELALELSVLEVAKASAALDGATDLVARHEHTGSGAAGGSFTVTLVASEAPAPPRMAALVELLVQAGAQPFAVRIRSRSLEQRFLEIVGDEGGSDA